LRESRRYFLTSLAFAPPFGFFGVLAFLSTTRLRASEHLDRRSAVRQVRQIVPRNGSEISPRSRLEISSPPG
jgi:hypothetical protein